MDYIIATIETKPEAVDILCAYLMDVGITGFEVEDPQDFSDFLETQTQYWDYVDDSLMQEKQNAKTCLKVYLSDNEVGQELLLSVRDCISRLQTDNLNVDFGSLRLSLDNIKEEDWANNWKQYYKPIPIGKKILIQPAWEKENSVSDRVVLKIDPGLLFGTGAHQTTQLCIEALEQEIKPSHQVLDIGCGSGILTIASLLLGALKTTAIDIDKNCVERVQKNAEMNEIPASQYHVYAGNILTDSTLFEHVSQPYDIVVANIVADVIIALCPIAKKLIKKGGKFIASGIITERLEEVQSVLENNGFSLEHVHVKDDWACIISIPQ